MSQIESKQLSPAPKNLGLSVDSQNSVDGLSGTPFKRENSRLRQSLRYAAARQFMQENSLYVTHFRPDVYLGTAHGQPHHGGLTVVYGKKLSTDFISLSVAVCCPTDLFCRKIGIIVAVESFMAGRKIVMPTLGRTMNGAVEAMFREYQTIELTQLEAAALLARVPSEFQH